jgi:ABC-type polysaccharide/polyol phosphate export permease
MMEDCSPESGSIIPKRLRNPFRLLNPKYIWAYLKSLVGKRKIIVQLAKQDFKNQYLGSFLGFFWAFFQPALFMFTLWLIFAIGFRRGRPGEIPFFLFLLSGMCVWNFFSESLNLGTGSIREKSYLVQKMVFKVSILPAVKICAALFIHLIFLLLLFIASILHGFYPTLHLLQLPYYLLLHILLLMGITWMTSALSIFIPDINQILKIVVRIGFWFTPIFWNIEMFAHKPKIQFILKLNPVFYLVNGYRESLFTRTWFWKHPLQTAYFWIIMGIALVSGALIFKKLKPHFGDVL